MKDYVVACSAGFILKPQPWIEKNESTTTTATTMTTTTLTKREKRKKEKMSDHGLQGIIDLTQEEKNHLKQSSFSMTHSSNVRDSNSGCCCGSGGLMGVEWCGDSGSDAKFTKEIVTVGNAVDYSFEAFGNAVCRFCQERGFLLLIKK